MPNLEAPNLAGLEIAARYEITGSGSETHFCYLYPGRNKYTNEELVVFLLKEGFSSHSFQNLMKEHFVHIAAKVQGRPPRFLSKKWEVIPQFVRRGADYVFYITDRIDGYSFEDWQKKRFEGFNEGNKATILLSYAIHLAESVEELHERIGIAHGAIAPSQFFFSDLNDTEKLNLLGIQAFLGFDVHLRESVFRYSAPEILELSPKKLGPNNEDLDYKAADIFSLAATLYKLLTTRYYFSPEAVLQHGFLEKDKPEEFYEFLKKELVNFAWKPTTILGNLVDDPLNTLLGRMFERVPKKRPRIREVVTQLKRIKKDFDEQIQETISSAKLEHQMLINFDVKLERLVHETGGFAYIYKGVSRPRANVEKFYAVKVLKDEYARDKYWKERFINEAEILYKVMNGSEHNIEIINMVNDDLGRLDFLIMEWIDGKTLERWFDRGKPIRNRLEIALGIASGLRAFHDEDEVHGDISYSNVLIRNKDGKAVLIDCSYFGNEKLVGNILFAAPELFMEGEVSGKLMPLDIYAFGATLFYLFTGDIYNPRLLSLAQNYAANENKAEIKQSIIDTISQGLRWPQDIGLFTYFPEIYGQIQSLLTKMLAFNPSERPEIYEVGRRLKEIDEQYKERSLILSQRDAKYYILSYVQINNQLVPSAEELVLEAREASEGADTIESEDLYPPPNQSEISVVIFKADKRAEYKENSSFNIGDKKLLPKPFAFKKFRYASIPFRIRAELGEKELNLKSSDGTILDSFGEDWTKSNQPISLSQREPRNLVFLVDRSMGAEELILASNLIVRTKYRLELKNILASSYVCYYGDYNRGPYTKTQRQLYQFELINAKPLSAEGLMNALRQELQRPISFSQKSYCGNLEFALNQLYKLRIPNQDNRVILLGASPAYPNFGEKSHFELYEYATEEYLRLYWKHELQNLHDFGFHILAYWFQAPKRSFPENVMRYISYQWLALNGNQGSFENYIVRDNSELERRSIDIVEWLGSESSFVLSPDSSLPLTRPLRALT